MQITTLKDIDLSKYKVAYYRGDSLSHYSMTQHQVMKLADAGHDFDYELPYLQIALIPKDKRLQDCDGDDWDDCCAENNASGFYTYPEGTIFLEGKLGGELRMVDKFS